MNKILFTLTWFFSSAIMLATSASPSEAQAFHQFQAYQLTEKTIAEIAHSPNDEISLAEAISRAKQPLVDLRALLINLQDIIEPGKEAALKVLRRDLQSLILLANKQITDSVVSPRETERKSISDVSLPPRLRLAHTCPLTRRLIEAEINNSVLTVRVFVPLDESSNPPAHPEISLTPEPELYADVIAVQLPNAPQAYQISRVDVHQKDVFSIILKEAGQQKEKRIMFKTAQNHPVYRYCGSLDGVMELYHNDLDDGHKKESGISCAIM